MFSITVHIICDWFSNISLQKIMHFLQPVISKTIGIKMLKSIFSKSHSQRKHLRSNTQIVIFQKVILILVLNYSWKCAPYTDTKNSFYTQCHLFPVLWECITNVLRSYLRKTKTALQGYPAGYYNKNKKQNKTKQNKTKQNKNKNKLNNKQNKHK